MILTIPKARHSGRDCRNPDSMDGFRLPSMALDTRFPAGMTHFFSSVAYQAL
ncbi:hypothetical protein [Methyloglobulus sp.]|uniref:hypothetical protein n=1 Tax=Methyloglobulus sp. TaxID=2518622 RepID=UPI0039891490